MAASKQRAKKADTGRKTAKAPAGRRKGASRVAGGASAQAIVSEPILKARAPRRGLKPKEKRQRKAELAEAVRLCDLERGRRERAGLPNTTPNFSRIAKGFPSGFVSRTTLRETWNGKRDVEAKGDQHRLLSTAQERALISWIRLRAFYGKPWSRRHIAAHVASILGRSPGIHWVTRFIKRHPATLRKSRAYALDPKRAMNFTRANVEKFSDMLKAVVTEENIPPSNIYNADEVGLAFGGGRKATAEKFVFAAEDRNRQALRSDNLEMATVLETTCADGTDCIPAGVIMKPGDFGTEWYQPDFEHRSRLGV